MDRSCSPSCSAERQGSPLAFQLVIQKGLEVGREYQFAQAEVSLGRHSEGDVVLMEAGVSRQHAKIVEEKGRYFLVDLGSANGTKLNGARVEGRAEIKSGDTVSLGPVIFQFTASQATQLISVEDLEKQRAVRRKADPLGDEIRTMSIASIADLKNKVAADPNGTNPSAVAPAKPAYKAAAAPAPSRPAAPTAAPARPSSTSASVSAAPTAAPARPSSSSASIPGAPAPSRESRPPARAAPPAPKPAANAAAVAEDPNSTRMIQAPTYGAPQPAEDPNSTRMIQAPTYSSPQVPKADATRMVAVPTAPPERPRTAPKADAAPSPDSTRIGAAPEPRVFVDSTDEQAEVPTNAPSNKLAERSEDGEMSAVEKARLRRQYGDSLGGQLQLAWAQMTRRERRIASSVIVGLLVVILVPTWLILRPEPVENQKVLVEAAELTQKPTEGVFGYGEGVDFDRRDMKAFKFSFVTPTRAVAVLRFMASDISANEVSISVNGGEAGFVSPDTPESAQRELMVVLPTTVLKRNDINEIIFDNVKNPPGEEPWRIWNASIEVIPLPEMSQRDLLNAAQDAVSRAKEFYERREVGADNRFRAWKGYRHAWITLEALGDKPELYDIVRYQLETIGKELDQQCGKMILAAERAVRLQQWKKARQALDEVTRYFPTAEHRCHNLSKYKIQQYELYDL